MEFICHGHKTCSLREECPHSKPHEQIFDESLQYGECVFPDNKALYKDCHCSNKILRKIKLEKLKKL